MANTQNITRRAALIGALTSSAALAVPAIAAVTPTVQHPWERARILAKELGEALADLKTDPTAPGEWIAVIRPAGAPYNVGFADREHYEEAWSRCMTPEQAEAIADWRMLTVEANDQWDFYCTFNRRCPEGEAAYAKWQEIYKRQQDAHIEMSRAFYPFRAKVAV